ncbi:BREX-3 system P-loop-containing protein BrxF [Bacillus megaterium]|uniref:BREX-3 system P-loop-containing protein BrxF n=1 Tax=Priestia megaterium TaxID=1404 RepID=UPI001293C78D|nr:BREX-3 system P-loop-containing protein BrxF [Priestia megaterium]MQR86861.1 BREX-3 system P-loop-containing protein BrxF [Priestia megaterium]
MNIHFLEQIAKSIPDVSQRYFKQIYVYDYKYGNSVERFSEAHSFPYININIKLSQLIQDTPIKLRTYQITGALQQLIDAYSDKVICLDYYELLFEPSLAVDPLLLIKNISRNKTLIVSWRGKIADNTFIHAEPGHPEYKKYLMQDTYIIK